MNSLFRELIENANLLGYELADKDLKKLYKLQKTNQDKLIHELALIMLKYDIKEEKLNLTDKEKLLLKEKLNKIVDEGIQLEFDLEKETTNQVLYQSADNSYKLRNYILSLGTIAKITALSEDELLKLINTVVDGKIWSDRLWTNKKQIEKELKKMVHEFLNGRVSVNKIYKEINSKYSKNAYNTKRLVETEICRVQEKANKEFNKKNGIEYVLYSATLDLKTSEICKERDGKVYRIDNAPTIPAHPNCRSCYIPLLNEDWRPKTRRDNTVIGKHIDYKDYKQWGKENY